MISFRRFLNCDSPGIVAVWNSQPPSPRRLSLLNCTLLEQYVLAKPYFDPQGLIVAVDGQRIVGFVHAGFLPGERPGGQPSEAGILCQLLVDPNCEVPAIARELLLRGEAYLRERGTLELLGGALGWQGPYYLGLHGGSLLAGVLADDVAFAAALEDAGYLPRCQQIVFQRELADFRLPMDRAYLQLRRQFRITPVPESPPAIWSEVCAWCWIDRDQLAVMPAAHGQELARFTFWNVEPMSTSWGTRAIGLLSTQVQGAWPQPESLPCFLAEALRHFQAQGVRRAEIQCREEDVPLVECCQRLGFVETARGTQFAKR